MRFTIAGAVAVARAKPGRMAAIGGEGEEVVGVSKAVSTCDVTITFASTPDNYYVVINGGVGPQGAQGAAGAAGAAGRAFLPGGNRTGPRQGQRHRLQHAVDRPERRSRHCGDRKSTRLNSRHAKLGSPPPV